MKEEEGGVIIIEVGCLVRCVHLSCPVPVPLEPPPPPLPGSPARPGPALGAGAAVRCGSGLGAPVRPPPPTQGDPNAVGHLPAAKYCKYPPRPRPVPWPPKVAACHRPNRNLRHELRPPFRILAPSAAPACSPPAAPTSCPGLKGRPGQGGGGGESRKGRDTHRRCSGKVDQAVGVDGGCCHSQGGCVGRPRALLTCHG